MNRTFIRLLKIASDYKLWMISASAIGFLTIGSSIGLMMTSAYIIAKAALHPSIAELQVGIVGVRFFGIARGVFRYVERYLSHETTFRLLAKFRVWFYESILPLFPSKLLKYKSGDLLTRAVNDVENLEHIFVRVIAPPFVAFFVLILMLFLLGSFSFVYSLILLLSFLFAGIGLPLLTYKLSKHTGSKLVGLQARMNELTLDQTQGLGELLVFNQVGNFRNKFTSTQNEIKKLQRKNAMISGLNESLIGLIMSISVILILIASVPKVNNGYLEGVYLSVLVLGVMASFEALLPLPTAIQFWEQSIKSADRLFEITDVKPVSKSDNLDFQKPKRFSITFDSVKFGYTTDKLIYNKLNFTVPEKTFTAVVGASGSGKSTLINLLTKFWDYQAGKILLGDTELQHIPQTELRKYISVLPQTTHLFNLSVKENIRFAKPEATDGEVYAAAQKANIHEFILSLPNQYDELVGEQGMKLSGGERRRIAMARAFLRNSPILICDEPTSDLDSINEEKIINTLYEYSKTSTVLIITHRLFHLEKANRILVMYNGKIIESGTHKELLQKKSYYYNMLKLETELIV